MRRSPVPSVVAVLLLVPLAALAGSRYVEPEKLMALIGSEDPPLVIDVRSAGEFLAGHVPGAVNIPHTEIEGQVNAIRGLASSGVIAVYDQLGPRSSRAARVLLDAGFNDLLELEGGYDNWKRRGMPTER